MGFDGSGNWIPVLPDPPAFTSVFPDLSAGTGVPDDADGENGDVYVNLTNGNVYSKSNNVWVLAAGAGSVPNLTGSGSPVGSVTPGGVGQFYTDTANSPTMSLWQADGLTSADWNQIL